ncbi:hypothetical protein OAF65_11075 [Verrucomicrobiales bacterium]|nr:hypothetical protein [Verrucomicrobiales bacterium]
MTSLCPSVRAVAGEKSGHLATFSTEEEWNDALDSLGEGALDNYTGL